MDVFRFHSNRFHNKKAKPESFASLVKTACLVKRQEIFGSGIYFNNHMLWLRSSALNCCADNAAV